MAQVIDTLLVRLGFIGVGSEVPKQHDAENKKAVDNVEKQEKRRTTVRKKGQKDRAKITYEEKKDKDKELKESNLYQKKEEAQEKEALNRKKANSHSFNALTLGTAAATVYAGKKLWDFTKGSVESSASLEVMSKSLADTPETLREWSNALEKISGNGEGAVSTIASLQAQINEFNTLGTNPEFQAQLSLLGINPSVTKGSEILDQLHDAIKNSPYSKTETATRMAGIGISPEMFALVSSDDYSGRMSVAKEQARNANAGANMSQRAMEEWRGLQQDIGSAIKNFGVDALNHLSESSKAKLFNDEKKYDSEIESNANKYGLPKELLQGLIARESAYNPNAVSPAGAKGVMQLMPGTEEQYGGGIDGGSHFLADMLKKYGNYNDALTAYNWGPANLDAYKKTGKGKDGQPMPSESQRFAPAVIGYAQDFQKHNVESGGNTTVTVHELNVVTQATESVGIGQAIKSCLTAQCENGMK